jgi:hypothetical protein
LPGVLILFSDKEERRGYGFFWQNFKYKKGDKKERISNVKQTYGRTGTSGIH